MDDRKEKERESEEIEEETASEIEKDHNQEAELRVPRKRDGNLYTVEEAVEKLGFGPFQVLVTFFTGFLWVADSMEVMLLSVLSPKVKCLWGLSDGEEAAITSVVFVGFFFGAFFWGALCDLVGRKTGLLFVNIAILVFGVLSAVPITPDPHAKLPSYPWLLLCRAGVGFGAGGSGQAITYYAEFLPKRIRGVCLVVVEFWWAIGSMIGAGLAVGVMVPEGLGWHWYLGLSTIPLFLALPLFLLIPESARYYIVKGKRSKAEKVIRMIARYNCKPPPEGVLVSFEEKEEQDLKKKNKETAVRYSEGAVVISESSERGGEESPLLNDDDDSKTTSTSDRKADKYLSSNTMDRVVLACKTKCLSFFDRNLSLMFKNKMWMTSVLLFFLWFGAAWLYYGIVLLTTQFLQHDPHCGLIDTPENSSNVTCRLLERDDYISILWTAVAEVPGLLITAVTVEVIGRKLTMVVEFLLTMVGFLLLFICGERIALTVFLFIIRAFATGVFQAIYVYTPEVYPTSIRAFALGICSAAARIGAITTPYIAQVLVETSDLAAISLYAGSCLMLAIASCLLPIETKGRSLQDEG